MLTVEFMKGHLSGIHAVGGTYDKTPKIYAGAIEREYEELEPYLNIYSGKKALNEELDINKEDMETLKQVLKLVKQGRIEVSH